MTRTGKIGRLPYGLRKELNFKIQNGQPGVEILEWLNGMKETRHVVGRHFGGRPVTEQNLTEWKAGGYKEWERHTETREWVEDLAGQADDFSDDVERRAPWHSIADRMSTLVAVELARSLKEITADQSLGSLERLDAILRINQAIGQLRRSDHGQKRMIWQAETKEREREAAEEEKEREEERQAQTNQMLQALYEEQEAKHVERMDAIRREAAAARAPWAKVPSMSDPTGKPATAAGPQGNNEIWEAENGVQGPVSGPGFQGKSGQIKVNQTSGEAATSAEEAAPAEDPEVPAEGGSGPENVWKGYPWPTQ